MDDQKSSSLSDEYTIYFPKRGVAMTLQFKNIPYHTYRRTVFLHMMMVGAATQKLSSQAPENSR